MSDGNDERPDRRPVTPETARLRRAARALRLHLDELPIDYNLDVPGDHYLTSVAFMFARQRYDCADSLIGAGFGGTVIGSIARSLFVDGLRWLWIGDDPPRRRSLLGDLLDERNRLCVLLDKTDTTCPHLPRWLMPIPDVADLTGASMTWLDVLPTPGEEDLLDEFFNRSANAQAAAPGSPLLHRVAPLLDMAGLKGASMVLAHAGHGNYLGLQSSLTDGGATGHDLRPDHEALFMHVAAVGATATLLGTTAALPGSWPVDVEREPFLQRAIDLAAEVAAAAVPIHSLGSIRRPAAPQKKKKEQQAHADRPLLRPQAILAADDLLPDIYSVDAVASAAENYYDIVRSMMIRPWDHGQPSLHAMLSYGGGHSNLQTVMSTYNQPGSAVISVFAARMLLEEAARLTWRFSVPGKEFENRAKQYFDEFRARQKKTINTLVASGVPKTDAERVFARPRNVKIVTPDNEIAKGRKPIPTIASMLRELGSPYPEPGWLEVAYSLLSQITHSTPLGQLHAERVIDGVWHGNELSPEMLSLALDTACLGSAHLIGTGAMLLTDSTDKSREYRDRLVQEAYVVHNAARFIHWLD
ncbi:hypothetical protein [Amycolatopsis sp. NPDC054798]